jgi:hypothetical protein
MGSNGAGASLFSTTLRSPIHRLFPLPNTDAFVATSHHPKPRRLCITRWLSGLSYTCIVLIGATPTPPKHGTQRDSPRASIDHSFPYHHHYCITHRPCCAAWCPRTFNGAAHQRFHRIPASLALQRYLHVDAPALSCAPTEEEEKKNKFAFRLLNQQQPRHDSSAI